jgi:hypothetical protein
MFTLLSLSFKVNFFLFNSLLKESYIWGKTFAFNFWCGPSFVHLSWNDVNSVGLINQQNILCFDVNGVSVYSRNGRLLDRYNVGNGSKVISGCVADLSDVQKNKIILIVAKKDEKCGKDIRILSFDGKITPFLKSSFKNLNVWKVQVADVDGDGQKEISFGVFKGTKFYPIPDKRPFIYSWKGKGIAPKWLGSKFSKPFDDYIFADLNGDKKDEIIVNEQLTDGRCIEVYQWDCFGVQSIAISQKYEDISDIKRGEFITGKPSEVIARVKQSNRWQWVVFKENGENLVEKERTMDDNIISMKKFH